jgi:hypothetical protein
MQVITPKIPLHLLTLSGRGVIRGKRCPFEMDRILLLIGRIVYPGQRIVEINLHRVRRRCAVIDRYRVGFYFRALPDVASATSATEEGN